MPIRRPMLWLAAGAILGAGAVHGTQERGFLALDGRDWTRFSGTERVAWMQGFLAGQAVRGVPDSLHSDSSAFAAELERQRRAGEFRFAYAVPLYVNRLSDHYVWENHRPQPLWLAMMEVERVRR